MLHSFLKNVAHGTISKFSPESPISCLMKTLADERETNNSKASCFTSKCKKLFSLRVYTFKQGDSSEWEAASSNKFYSKLLDGFCFKTKKMLFLRGFILNPTQRA